MSFETCCFGDLLAEPQRNGLNRPKKGTWNWPTNGEYGRAVCLSTY